MTKIDLPRPTNSELTILQVLWRHGACTVKAVHEHLNEVVGYTTTLRMLQIMTEKGLVVRDENQRAHIYKPQLTEAETQGQILSNLMEKAFSGSNSQLVMRALSVNKTSPEELAEIKKLVARLTKEQQ